MGMIDRLTEAHKVTEDALRAQTDNVMGTGQLLPRVVVRDTEDLIHLLAAVHGARESMQDTVSDAIVEYTLRGTIMKMEELKGKAAELARVTGLEYNLQELYDAKLAEKVAERKREMDAAQATAFRGN